MYAYAHLPQMFKAQRQLNAADLPTPEVRLALLGLTIEKLIAAGYVYIGMDHFALPQDELVIAQGNGTLHRNFQGYSTRGYCDLIGLGVSSIGKVGDNYMQNLKTLPEYYGALDRGELAVHRGLTLTRDDVIRRDVIQQIMCYGVLDFDKTGERFGIDFWQLLRERARRARADGRRRPRRVRRAGPARAAGRPAAAAPPRHGVRRLPRFRAGRAAAVQQGDLTYPADRSRRCHAANLLRTERGRRSARRVSSRSCAEVRAAAAASRKERRSSTHAADCLGSPQ